ncbi:methyltransferase domain-containing protein [Janibacter terrae]|uniref:Methyltransferase domain-containing protein n=1 Tax=Janibacter terrae TaxID=103817 RepID=A0ABZ2FDG9_9MICO
MTAPATPERVLWQARREGFAPGEFVGQQSFVSASEVGWLASRARVAPGVRVLDLCCGLAGPGLWVTGVLGCDYLGVDADADAIATARRRASELGVGARFVVGRVPPLPPGTFEVVLLLETLLAFRDKATLLVRIAAALEPGGRCALTVEAGDPLGPAERAVMPGSDTVWPTPFAHLRADLEAAGLRLVARTDRSLDHARVALALAASYERRAPRLDAVVGAGARRDIVAGHRLWAEWLASGRIRKYCVVAERVRAQRLW